MAAAGQGAPGSRAWGRCDGILGQGLHLQEWAVGSLVPEKLQLHCKLQL